MALHCLAKPGGTSLAKHRLIVVGYIQLMNLGRKAESRQELSELPRGLKILDRDLDGPVMALSQLNRSLE